MRLDEYLYENGYYPSRTKASEAVRRGEVTVDGNIKVKPSLKVTGGENIKISEKAFNFVSNGGYKLEKAFEEFGISVDGEICADIGASTGGFTDCLLRRGAKRVFCIDVGESLLSEKLKNDSRVCVLDNFNARELKKEDLGGEVGFVCCDVSFISLTYVLKNIYDVLSGGGTAVVLIKPQFEVGKKNLNKNGIVKDPRAKKEAVEKIFAFSESVGFSVRGIAVAPVKTDKNTEYLMLLRKGAGEGATLDKIVKIFKI